MLAGFVVFAVAIIISFTSNLDEYFPEPTPEPTSDDPFEGISDDDITTYSDLFDIPPPENDNEAIKLGKQIRDWIKNDRLEPGESNLDEYFPGPNNWQRFELIEPEFENNENLKMLPQKNLNKKTTPGHFFGFPIDSKISILEATNSQEKFSIRFTSKFSGNVSNIILPMETNIDDEVKVGLQESIDGYPSGIWLASNTAYTYPLSLITTKVLAINFTQNVPIESGKIYHIVIEPTIKKNDHKVSLTVYENNWHINSLNHTDPDETWMDPSINTLFFDGESWLVTEKWPSFVIKYSNGVSYGQPYTIFAPWVIGEKRYVGQAVIPYSNYKIDEIAFVVSTKGNPMDDLHYVIYDSENNIIRDGIFAKKGEIDRFENWWSKTIGPPITLESGKLYRVVLYSPNSTIDDGYFVYGHEFMLDKTLGFGSTIHHLTARFNEQGSWTEWYDADAAFKFIITN